MPQWLYALSIAALGIGFTSAAWVAFDLVHRPQRMKVMNIVWPVVALSGGPAAAWLYRRHDCRPDGESEPPFAIAAATGTCHCGAGCTLGDICAEWLVVAFPALALGLGWPVLFPDKIFAVWVLDFLFAFLLGVVFQYFSQTEDRSVWRAVKTDFLSLTAWQIGMYAFMAFAKFYLFGRLLEVDLQTDSVAFWFMMQIAMICGFATSYPVNRWLIRSGIKQSM